MDVTAASLDLSRDSLIANLTASRLLGEEEVREFSSLHPDLDGVALSQAFVGAGLLTAYQLASICEGFAGDLRIGNYDVLDKLGAGGMGTVLKARHRRMKRIVALKLLLPKFCSNESFVKRFQREVETIARLGHPNIVMAYDADECEAGHFLVMEFVDGRDLASTVEKGGPMDVSLAVDCVLQSARGLAYAHSLGIIHRDIKPANLLRDKSGVVKVTDLGLARLAASSPDAAQSTGITQAGFVLGTPDYMPPEQAVDSTDLDQRADIYSLGATLFYLVTGGLMYPAQSLMAVLMKHREAEIPPLKGAPPELDAIYRKMVAKRPENRFQSMGEVVAALESVAASKTGQSPQHSETLATSKADLPTVSQRWFKTLIVEPSRVQTGIIRKFLEAQDFSVVAAVATGAEALAAIRQHKPDAVLCSHHLADTSGVDLAGLIHAELEQTAPGFVLIASEDDGSKSGPLSRISRTVLLLKPFTPEQLVLSLNLVTGRSLSVKAAESSLAGVPSLKPAKRDLATLKVLIVDDSTVCRVHEKGVLEQLGFRTFVEASDGANAIAAAAREPFDLIVTDYNMPLMDGHALISYLKQNPATSRVPIVMVTTETAPAVLDPVRALGVAAILEKRFPLEDVKALMDRLFA